MLVDFPPCKLQMLYNCDLVFVQREAYVTEIIFLFIWFNMLCNRFSWKTDREKKEKKFQLQNSSTQNFTCKLRFQKIQRCVSIFLLLCPSILWIHKISIFCKFVRHSMNSRKCLLLFFSFHLLVSSSMKMQEIVMMKTK